MPASRTRWVAIAVLAVAIVAIFLIWRGCRPAPVEGPVGMRTVSFDNLQVLSPDLAVGPAEVKADSYRGYTDWACRFECREPEGCHAEVRLMLDYAGGGAEGRIIASATLDANEGETMRIGRVQRPPAATIDGVTRLELEVVQRMGPDAPTPFVVF